MQYPIQTQKSSLEAKLAGKPFSSSCVPADPAALVEGIFSLAAGRPANWSDPLKLLAPVDGLRSITGNNQANIP
jgi:hypothetical protein